MTLRTNLITALTLVAILNVPYAGQAFAQSDQASAQEQDAIVSDTGPDPALANMASVPAKYAAIAPSDDSYNQPSPVQSDDTPPPTSTTDQAFLTDSDQPPPDLPDYDQPDAPADDFLWTPGYWALGSVGYIWIPGLWTRAPFYGALWTPPYWGFYQNRYVFHPGYWGTHVGFYGGVNYGFGYIGTGYFGGFWRGHSFFYNRSVNNIGRINGTYVYNRTVVYNGRTYGAKTTLATSFNGGATGIAARPLAAERVAAREPRMAETHTQRSFRLTMAHNPRNAFSQNGGHPVPMIRVNTGIALASPAGAGVSPTMIVRPRPEIAESMADAKQADRQFSTQQQQRIQQMRERLAQRQQLSATPSNRISSSSSGSTYLEPTHVSRIPPTTTSSITTSTTSSARVAETEQNGPREATVVAQPTEPSPEEEHTLELQPREAETLSHETGKTQEETLRTEPQHPEAGKPREAEPQHPEPGKPHPAPLPVHPVPHY
jgi:hypothetical protein